MKKSLSWLLLLLICIQSFSMVFMINNSLKMEDELRLHLQANNLTIVTILSSPYTMRVDDHESQTGNDIYEGYCIDVIKVISKILNFNYTIKLVKDGRYGSKDANGDWGGMVRELMDGKADLAIADLTITSTRKNVIDFTMPYMTSGIGILLRKPWTKPPTIWNFIPPLAIKIWIYLIVSSLAMTLLLFVISHRYSYKSTNSQTYVQDVEKRENNISVQNPLWFTTGILMQQGCEIMPRTFITRLLAATFFFFILILISLCSANLTDFLTGKQSIPKPIQSAEDLISQKKISYGCIHSGSTQRFFRESKIYLYQKMWLSMMLTGPSAFVDSNHDGLERVRKGDYAFLGESNFNEYIAKRECDLYQVGGLLNSIGYGVATPLKSPYKEIMSKVILQLQEDGTLQRLKNKWWSVRNNGDQCVYKKSITDDSKIRTPNLLNVLVSFVSGLMITLIMYVLEFIWNMKKIPKTDRPNVGNLILQE